MRALPALSQRHPGRIWRRPPECVDHDGRRTARRSGGPRRSSFRRTGGANARSSFARSGLERASVYITNAVKHFKNEPRGKRRLHKHPNRYEAPQCRWWLDAEFAALDPKLVIALGATAASALMGRAVSLTRERGRLLHWPDGRAGLATIHPSAVLRTPDDAARRQAFAGLVSDLRVALTLMEGLSGSAE